MIEALYFYIYCMCVLLNTDAVPHCVFELTTALAAQEARQLALAALLFVVGQELVDELPDKLFGWSVQHRKHIHYQSVHIPANNHHPHISRSSYITKPC